MNDTSPEVLGEFLRARAKYAKNTCEKKGQISRVDAICWFLSQVSHATPREVKRFATAFKGFMPTYSTWNRKTCTSGSKKDLEMCSALLNIAYGGVGAGFEGRLCTCLSGAHYGPIAPLYRPLPRTYAVTIGGLQRSRRVQDYLDRAACQRLRFSKDSGKLLSSTLSRPAAGTNSKKGQNIMSKNSKKAAGEKMMDALEAASGPLTTEALASAAGLTPKDAYSRLWWLQKKDGVLKSTGHGKERRWQFTAAVARERSESEG